MSPFNRMRLTFNEVVAFSCGDKLVINLRCKDNLSEILHLLCSCWHIGIYITLIVYEDVVCVIATLTTKRRRKWRT